MYINIYLMNNKTKYFWKIYLWRKLVLKSVYFLGFRADPEQNPDQLFHETDRKIRIHIKMRRIWLVQAFNKFNPESVRKRWNTS